MRLCTFRSSVGSKGGPWEGIGRFDLVKLCGMSLCG